MAFLGISGVDLFFVISGFIMVYISWRRAASIRRSLNFLYARFTRIYPFYWFVAGLVYIVWLVWPDVMNFDAKHVNLLKSFMLWPQIAFPMVDVAWTLIYELYFYLVFALILLFAPRLRIFGLIAWFVLVLIGCAAGWAGHSSEFAVMFSPLNFEFLMGATAGLVYVRGGFNHPRFISLAGLIFAVIIALGLISTGHFLNLGTPWVRSLAAGPPAALIVFGLAIYDRQKIYISRHLEAIGNWSYSLYLTHVLTLSVCGRVWQKFACPGPWDNIIMSALMITASLLIAYIIWRFIERPALTTTRKLGRKIFSV